MNDELLLQILHSPQSSSAAVESAFSRLFMQARDKATMESVVKIFIKNHPEKAKEMLGNLEIPPNWFPAGFCPTTWSQKN